MTLYTHGNAVQYKVGGDHYLAGGGVEYVPVSGYEGPLLVEPYGQASQPWPAPHALLPMDDSFDPGERPSLPLAPRSPLSSPSSLRLTARVLQAWRAWAR